MNTKKIPLLVIDLIFGFLTWFLGLFVGCEICLDSQQKSAIAAGVAYWQVDPKTGSAEFKWKQTK